MSRPLLPSPSRVRLKEYCSLLLGSSPLFLHLSHSSPSWYILYFLSRPVQHVPRYGYIHIWLCPYMVIPIIILGLNLSPIHRMSHAQFEWDCKISPPACACMYVSNKSAPWLPHNQYRTWSTSLDDLPIVSLLLLSSSNGHAPFYFFCPRLIQLHFNLLDFYRRYYLPQLNSWNYCNSVSQFRLRIR